MTKDPPSNAAKLLPVPVEAIERRIFLIRAQKVMLSTHLAEIYGVQIRVLVQAVRRNIERFPEDFMFQLNPDEFRSLRSQIVILENGRGRYPKYRPYAFTEQGVAMLSSVLRSKRAIQVNIAIMRAFVRLREVLATHKELARQFQRLERKVQTHDAQIQAVFDTIRKLMKPPRQPRPRPIGFVVAGGGRR